MASDLFDGTSDASQPAAARLFAVSRPQCEEAAPEPAEPGTSLFTEFRRKLAQSELLSRSAQKLAEALRFSGRITLTFHQGKVTKAVLEESYIRPQPAGEG